MTDADKFMLRILCGIWVVNGLAIGFLVGMVIGLILKG